MALPPGITPKTVTVGVASFFDGALAEGTATITAPVNVVHNPSNRPIFSSRMVKRFVDGEASFDLAPTDAAGLNRVDWTYKLNVVIQGALVQPDPIYFTLPAAGPDVIDLDALVPVPSSAGMPVSVAVLTAEELDGYTAQYLGDPTSATATAARAAFVHLNDAGELVIVVDGVETIVGGGGGGGLTTEQVQDLVASMVLAGTNVTKVYDDANGTLTLSAASGTGGTTDPEVVRDTIAAALVAGSGVTITPNDDGNTITITATGGAGYTDEQVRDVIGATLVAGPGATVTPDDGGETITISAGATAGVRTSGYSIPAGSLAVWDAARDSSATVQRDVTIFGDSTTEGVLTPSGTGAGYVPALRSLAIADGVTDGGRGQIDGIYDTAVVSGENFGAFVSRTGWAAAVTNTPPGPNSFASNTVGDVLTLQYKAPANAMRVRCSSNAATGRLTVAVDGATIGTIDPYVLGQTYGQTVKAFTGLPAGGPHTVTVTNTGGAPAPAPQQFRTAGSATTGGAVTPGAYTYATTFVDTSGRETTLGPTASITVPAGTSTNTVTTAMDTSVPGGIAKARLYRASGAGVSNPASFQMVLEQASNGGAQIILIDVGNAPGAAPATSNTAVLDPANGGPKAASIAVDFYDSTRGITFHRVGYSGQKYVTSFNPAGQPLSAANFDTQTHLGLSTGLGGTNPAYDWTVTVSSNPDRRRPALAMCAYGINDMNQATAQTDIIPAVQNGVAAFVRFCRAAGCDPLVIVPHLEYATDAAHLTYLAQVRDAIVNTADAHGVAWVDFNQALPPFNAASAATYGTVHLTQAGYDAEASYLWDNVLSASAAR